MNKIFKNQIPGNGSVCVLLYGYVGDGEKVDSGRVVAELMELSAAYRKIDIRINSKGGDVFSGIAIFNALWGIQADITIYIDGIAASIASVIALCGKPLYMSRYARLMLHRVSGGTFGNAEELRRVADETESLDNTLAEMVATRCNMSAAEVKATYFDGKDHWITAEEALRMGLCDGIFDVAEEIAPDPTPEDIYNFFTNRLDNQAQQEHNMTILDTLKKMPTFANVQTEAEVVEHIASLESQAAKVPALETKVTELSNRLTAQQDAADTAFLDAAKASGKITDDQLPTFRNLLKSDRENTTRLINSMKPARQMRASEYINSADNKGGGKSSDLIGMSWDEIDKADRLAELKDKYPEEYQNKYNAKFGK